MLAGGGLQLVAASIQHGGQAPCRIFLSYSREDLEHAKELLKRLEINFDRDSLKQATGLHIADVFFDEVSLRGENDWPEGIERQLDACQMLILLVSANSLRKGGYCRKVELPLILKRNPQPRLITVHLEDVSGWDEMDIADGRTLQRSRGFPIVNGKLVSLKTAGMPWNLVISDLHEELMLLGPPGELAAPKPPVQAASMVQKLPAGAPPALDEKLLPYFCNQQTMENDFLDGIDVWKCSQTAWALTTLYKGCYDDGLRRLARRMRFKHLRTGTVGMSSADEYQLEWPDPEGMRPERQVVFVVNDLLQKLGVIDGVTSVGGLPQAAVALGAVLQQRNSPLHVVAALPDANLKDTAAGIKGVLKFLEDVPVPQPRPAAFRLMLDLFLEPNSWDQTTRLAKSCKLPGATASHLLELSLPELLKDRDVRNWHRSHLSDQIHPDALMQPLGTRLPVRQRVFAELVEPLLAGLLRR